MKTFLFLIAFFGIFTLVGTIETKDNFNEERLVEYLEKCNVKNPDIVLRQAKLETGHFSSKHFREDNNLFGMKYAYNRPTTAIGRNVNGTAIYHSWQHSVIDYMIFQDKYYKGGDYYQFLKRVYAEDSVYTRKLKGIR